MRKIVTRTMTILVCMVVGSTAAATLTIGVTYIVGANPSDPFVFVAFVFSLVGGALIGAADVIVGSLVYINVRKKKGAPAAITYSTLSVAGVTFVLTTAGVMLLSLVAPWIYVSSAVVLASLLVLTFGLLVERQSCESSFDMATHVA